MKIISEKCSRVSSSQLMENPDIGKLSLRLSSVVPPETALKKPFRVCLRKWSIRVPLMPTAGYVIPRDSPHHFPGIPIDNHPLHGLIQILRAGDYQARRSLPHRNRVFPACTSAETPLCNRIQALSESSRRKSRAVATATVTVLRDGFRIQAVSSRIQSPGKLLHPKPSGYS